ncbi:polysaccharide pyruvyl transferase family protein [Cellulosimicrobium terreum]|nr:polysaccharide pyruvyl transferase family protein [Cellulosimicrobium terreum]
MPPASIAFCSVVAQEDNLGDVVIRREMVEWLVGACDRVYAYAGSLEPSYVAALELGDRVVVVRSAARFQAGLVRAVLTPSVVPVLTFAPGPALLVGSLRALARETVNLVNVLLVRAGNGRVLTLGRSVRGSSRPARALERSSFRAHDLYVARDEVTRSILGAGVVVAPDLALATIDDAGEDAQHRSRLVLSFRGDRQVDDRLFADLLDVARRLGLEPVLVTQVARDDAQHRRLARHHEVAHLGWDGTGHHEQLEQVGAVMRQTEVVVSDRLHALVLGARAGAVVAPVVHDRVDKLTATLAAVPTGPARSELSGALLALGIAPVVVDAAAARATLLRVRADVERRVVGRRIRS